MDEQEQGSMRIKHLFVGVSIGFMIIAGLLYYAVSIFDLNSLKPFIIQLVKDTSGLELTIHGHLKIEPAFLPKVKLQNLSIEQHDLEDVTLRMTVSQTELTINPFRFFNNDFLLSNIVMIEPVVKIQTGMTSHPPKTDLSPGTLDSNSAERRSDSGVLQIGIQKGKLFLNDLKTGQKDFIQVNNADIMVSFHDRHADVEMDLSYHDVPVRTRGNLAWNPGDSPDPITLEIDVLSEALKATLAVKGIVSDFRHIDLRMTAQSSDIEYLLQSLAISLPVKGAFHCSGLLKGSEKSEFLLTDLKLAGDHNKLSGDISVDLSGKKPSIRMNLNTDRLDLRPYLSPEKESLGEPAEHKNSSQTQKRLFSSKPFNLKEAELIDVVAVLDFKEVLTHTIAMEEFNVKAYLRNGRLFIESFRALVGDSEVYSDLELTAAANQQLLVKTQLIARKIDLQSMGRRLGFSKSISGDLDLEIDLQGQGSSLAELMGGLNGTFISSLYNGKIPASFIDFAGSNFLDTFVNLANPFAKEAVDTLINCAISAFEIKDGIAESRIFFVDDPQKMLLAEGTINLKTETIDFKIIPKPKKGLGVDGIGNVSISLGKITRPFKLGGTLAAPMITLDTVGLLRTVGTAFLGPAGVAWLMVSGSVAQDNPCVNKLKTMTQSDFSID